MLTKILCAVLTVLLLGVSIAHSTGRHNPDTDRSGQIYHLDSKPVLEKQSWTLIVGSSSYQDGSVTHIDGFSSRENCMASAQFAAQGHNTPTAYCILVK